jgi:hypothetical protein
MKKKSIFIGGWFVLIKHIVAYQDTGIVNTQQTVDVLLKSSDTLSGRISVGDYLTLRERFANE